MPEITTSTDVSRRIGSAQAEILRLARTVAPQAEIVSFPGRDTYSCLIVVDTDDEKARIKNDPVMLSEMTETAASVGRRPDHLSVESQETVDRRWGGNWHQVWR